jgi:diacylglycerol kinase family enzyme
MAATEVVVNRAAGSLKRLGADAFAERVRAGLAATHGEVSVQLVEPARLAATLERLAAETPARVVVAGGDGTINTAIGVFAGSEVALGILPLGTMNLTARDLGIPLDPDAAIAALAGATARRIDVAAVEDRIFAHHVSFGLHARMIRLRDARGPTGKWAKRLQSLWTALRLWWRPVPLELSLDGSRARRVGFVGVTNNRLGEMPGLPPSRERLDEGRLGLYVVEHVGRWGLLKLAADVAAARWHSSPRIAATTARTVTIESHRARLTASIDGEVVRLVPPVRCRSLPAHLTVLVPAAQDRPAG